MNNFFLKVACLSFSLITNMAFASEMDRVSYWSNAKGLVQANHCKLEATSYLKFGIASNSQTNNVILKKNEGLSNLSIVNNSLVKIKEGITSADSKIVEVVSVNAINSSDDSKNNFGFSFKSPFGKNKNNESKFKGSSAIRGDEGAVELSNLKSLKSFTFQINNNYKNIAQKSYLKVYFNESFVKLNCPEFINNSEYIIFNVYRDIEEGVISRVAVSTSETELFKDMSIFPSLRTVSSKVYDSANTLNDIIVLSTNKEKAVQANVNQKITIRKKTNNDILDRQKIGIEKLDIFKTDSYRPHYNGDVSTQTGTDTVICTQLDYVNVRSEDLNRVIFTMKPNDRVKVFQGWGNNEIEGYVDGKIYRFTKVEFLDKEDNKQKIGYIVSSSIKAKSDCNDKYSYSNINLKPADTTFKGFNDEKCCIFPVMKNPKANFTSGTPSFGASRDKGARTHAAVDLYREVNEPVYAVAPGVVISNLYHFYLGTYALEVLHSGGFVVRYGELTGKEVENVYFGQQIKMGDRVGYVAKINVKGCCQPMLHFELFSGKLNGPLTQENVTVNGVYYARRQDLMNPTNHMLKWKNKTLNK